MGGVKTENVTNRVVMLGDNHFESMKVTLGAGEVIRAGEIVKRDNTDGELKHATTADDFIGVNPFEVKNDTTATKGFGVRIIVSGRVRMDMLNLNGSAATPADCEKLRKVGILPVKVTDLSIPDNQ